MLFSTANGRSESVEVSQLEGIESRKELDLQMIVGMVE